MSYAPINFNNLLRKGLTFGVKEDKRLQLYIQIEGNQIVFAELVTTADKEAYNAGIERNHKLIIDLKECAEAILTAIKLSYVSDRLSNESYEQVFIVFGKVINRRMNFETFLKYAGTSSEDTWVE
jgi:uncharacterized protein with ParB-like and HNH nuclease domain